MSRNISMRRQAGLSLVELMVSLLLGLILASGIVSVYLESKRNFQAEEEMARIQENGRFALSLLKRELTLAGFFAGYFDIDELTPPSGLTDCNGGGSGTWTLDVTEPVELINDYASTKATTSGTVLDTCLNSVKVGTDVLAVKRVAGQATVYEGNFLDSSQTALDASQVYLEVEDYGDSKTWEDGAPSVDPNDVVEYWEAYSKIFYVRTYSVSSSPSDEIPTLCVRTLINKTMTEQCLVEGIEDMQVVFGVDQSGDSVPDYYTPDPNDMSDAVTARVYLLARSIGDLAGSVNANTKTYELGLDPNGVTFDDAFMRRIFSTTVQMRNSVLPALN